MVDEGVELGLVPVGAGVVAVGLGLVDLRLQVADALLVVATCLGVDHLAGRRFLDRDTDEVEAVDLTPVGLDETQQVVDALGGAQRDGPTGERELAQVAQPSDRALGEAGRGGVALE